MPAPRCQPSLLLAGSPVLLPLRVRKAWLVRDAGMYWCGRFWVDRIDADACASRYHIITSHHHITSHHITSRVNDSRNNSDAYRVWTSSLGN